MSSLGESLRRPDFSTDMITIEKSILRLTRDFYRPHRSVTELSEGEVDDIRKKLDVSVVGQDIPRPIEKFSQIEFPEEVERKISSAGFSAPTAIQCQGWPVALSGRDCVCVADTGSGKTLAYTLPALVHIAAQPSLRRGDGPIALVLAPTRELAVQIQQECSKFSSRTRNTCLYGGAPKGFFF